METRVFIVRMKKRTKRNMDTQLNNDSGRVDKTSSACTERKMVTQLSKVLSRRSMRNNLRKIKKSYEEKDFWKKEKHGKGKNKSIIWFNTYHDELFLEMEYLHLR